MSKSSVFSFEDCFQLPNQGLKTYFGRVVNGQPSVYVAPFAGGETTAELLSNWEKVLVSIGDKWPSLLQYENDMREKVGPLSVMKPLSARKSDIWAYYKGITLPAEPIMDSAVSAVLHEWSGSRNLVMRNQRDTVSRMRLSTNSGSPYFTKRKNVLKETIPCGVYNMGNSAWQSLNNDEYGVCAVLGWRGQEGGPNPKDVKQRVVWMFPFAINIMELQLYQPLIEAAQRSNMVPAWVGMESVDRSITQLFDTKQGKDLVVCTDFSKFDQHFNHSLQDAARQLIKGIFTPGVNIDRWLRDIFPIKYNIPLAYDYGRLLKGEHGMGSGSGGTNADETLAHRALQYEAALRRGVRLNPNSQCLGDDGVLSYPGITVEDVVQSYTKHGLEMNESKQYASTDDCVYLRRWHHKDYRVNGICVGVYSTYRALGRLRYIERYYDPEVWGPKMVALRQLSIIENVKYHPLRDQFAEFCMKRDKYRLGIDIPGFLDNVDKIASEAMELMPDFMGYTKTQQSAATNLGISGWWIVNYLRSKSK